MLGDLKEDAKYYGDRAAKVLFRKKPFEVALREAQQANLHRCLNSFDLTMIGLASIIGAGIFVVTGVTAKEKVACLSHSKFQASNSP